MAKPTVLFNGKTWNGYGFTVKTGVVSPTEMSQIKDGVIRLSGSNPGYLMSKDVYSKFRLTAEFRWVTDTNLIIAGKKRNSGLMYHVLTNQKDTLWPKGIQFQIKDKATGDFVLLQGVTLSVNDSVYGPGSSVVVKHFTEAELPIGEWNKIEIVVSEFGCEHFLNGVLVNKGIDSSVNSGRILLQYEGIPIDFRNIAIKRIKK